MFYYVNQKTEIAKIQFFETLNIWKQSMENFSISLLIVVQNGALIT